MAITYPAAYSSVQGDGGNNGLAITTDSTPVTDDVLVVCLCVNGNSDTLTPPGGWTEATVGDNSIASTGGQIRAWYLVDPAASTTYTWTVGTSTRRSIVGQLVRGVDNTTPIDVKGSLQNGPGANHTPPSLTTTVDNAGVVDFIGLRQFSPDTANFTVPASGLTWTEQKDVQGADSNNNIRLACGTAVAGSAGAVSTAVWTSADVNEDTIIIRVALKPAAAAAADIPWNPQRSVQLRDYGEAQWLQRDRRDANTVSTAANPLASPLDTAWQASARYWHLYNDVAERDSRAYFYQRQSPAEITAPAAAVQYVTARWPQPRDTGEQPWLQRRPNDISLLNTAQLENELLGGGDSSRHTLVASTHAQRWWMPRQPRREAFTPGLLDTALLESPLLVEATKRTLPHADRREVPQQRTYISDPSFYVPDQADVPAGDMWRRTILPTDRRQVPQQPPRRTLYFDAGPGSPPLTLAYGAGGNLWHLYNTAADVVARVWWRPYFPPGVIGEPAVAGTVTPSTAGPLLSSNTSPDARLTNTSAGGDA